MRAINLNVSSRKQVKFPASAEAQIMSLGDFLETGFADVVDFDWARKFSSAVESGSSTGAKRV